METGIELANIGQSPTGVPTVGKPTNLMTLQELGESLGFEPDPADLAEWNEKNEAWYAAHPWIREKARTWPELHRQIRYIQKRKGADTGLLDDNGQMIHYGDWLSQWEDNKMICARYRVDRFGRAYCYLTRDALPLDAFLDTRRDDGYRIIALTIKQ